MKQVYFFILGLFIFNPYALAVNCECPAVQCNACETTDGLDFYTTKCELTGKLMSCSKPKCSKLNPLPEACVSDKSKAKRTVASGPRVEDADLSSDSSVEVGSVTLVQGKSWVISTLKKKSAIQNGHKIYESDTIETSSKGKVKIVFIDKNVLSVSPSTKLEVSEYRASQKQDDRKALFKLLQGKVRSKVKNKYDGSKTSHFRIKTKSAVAGVRGTDFVVSYKENTKEVTKVQTLEGEVKLKDNHSNDAVAIKRGQYASFVAVKSDVFNKEDMNEFVKRGYLTPVYKLTQSEIAQLDWSTDIKLGKKRPVIADTHEEGMICQSPTGKMNSCLWTCENNPSGEQRCRTDIKDVRCVRKRCNANGLWSEESRMPSSQGYNCPAESHKVAPCDY